MKGDRAKHCIFELYRLMESDESYDENIINEVMADATKDINEFIEKANRNESLKYKCDVMTETVLQLEEENKELQRLAEIGKATNKMFKEYPRIGGKIFSKGEKYGSYINVINFDTKEELIEWYRKEVSNESK